MSMPPREPREPSEPQPHVPRLPPPGWMADPAHTGVERFWDGFAWTEYTRPAGAGHEWVAPRAPGQDWHTSNPRTRPPRRRSERRGVGVGVWLFGLVAAGVVAVIGYLGALPTWTHWPEAWVMAAPTGPEVEYPVFGSDELVLYLARSMVAQEETINVTFAGAASEQGMDDLNDAMLEAIAQNPYVFVQQWEVSVRAASTTVRPTYIYPDAEAEARRVATRDAVAQLVMNSGALTAATQTDQVTQLHNAIAASATYDWDAYDAISAGDGGATVASSQEAYGILVDGKAVCTGYAETMLLAAHAAGLRAVVVTGEANTGLTVGGHAWNRVLVDGVWRVVDVTWDDVPVGRSGTEVLRHDYLLLPLDSPLLDTRVTDGDWVVDGNEAMYS